MKSKGLREIVACFSVEVVLGLRKYFSDELSLNQLRKNNMSNATSVGELQVSAKKIVALLEKLPPSKVQELLDFGDFLFSRLPPSPKREKLGDRFAGVWEDERSAEEIIADINSNRIDKAERESL